MMKFVKCISVLLLLCFATDIQAQIGVSSSGSSKNRNDNEEIMNQFLKGMIKNEDGMGEITGSPYYEAEFQPAVLFFPENDPIPAKVRYNVVKEEMQISLGDENFRVLHDGILLKIKNVPFKKYSYRAEDKGVTLLGYFEILTKDFEDKELILLKKHYKDVKRGKEAAAMQNARPAKFIGKSNFYLKFADSNHANLVDRKLKNFLTIFPEEHRGDLENFIKNNKLSHKKEEDLIAIVDYYNSRF